MLLVDQVDVLRRNLPEIKEMRCALPLCGGYKNTKAAYHFASLLLPARDIITTIKAVEPRENTLPDRIRGWKITVTDEYRNEELTHLKDILGKIIHMHYLRFDEELDVSCVFHSKAATDYTAKLPPISHESCHPLHGKAATLEGGR